MWWQMRLHIFPSSNSWTFLTFSSVVHVKISSFAGTCNTNTTWNKSTRTESIQYYLNLTTGHHQPVNTTELVTCHAKHKKGSQKSKPSQTNTHTLLYHKTHSTRLSLTHLLSLRSSSKNDVLPVIWFFFEDSSFLKNDELNLRRYYM